MAKLNKPFLEKPQIYGSIDVWGNILNENIDKSSVFMDEIIRDSESKDQELARLEKDKVNLVDVNPIVQKTVDKYVETNVKPELDRYLTETSKPNLDNYVVQKKTDLDNYNTNIKKPELDTYTNAKKKELDTYEKVKESELNKYTETKQGELNTHTNLKIQEITDHTTTKIGEIDTHVVTKKEEITTYTDDEKLRLTRELDDYNVIKKGDLDKYEKDKETQLNSYILVKKEELDTHTTKKQDELDVYEKTKETELGQYASNERDAITNHTTAKIGEITTHTDGEKQRITTHTDSEIKRVTAGGTAQLDLISKEGSKQVNLVIAEGNTQVQNVINASEALNIRVTNLESGKLNKGAYQGTAEDLNTSINNVKNSIETVLAGKGLSQAKVNQNKTFNIVSDTDGITINEDSIKLEVINNLTTSSATKPLSAEQGKVLKQSISDLETDKLNKTDAEITYVKKTGDTMTGILKVNTNDNNNIHILKNMLLKGEFGVRGSNDGIFIHNNTSGKNLVLFDNGSTSIPASNLLTINREVIGAINELYTLLIKQQPSNSAFISISVSRDENNSSPILQYEEQSTAVATYNIGK